MRAVVFAGPSIHGLCRYSFPGIEFQPPAAGGDLLRAVYGGATEIGLIDGTFESTTSAWHKEILYALSSGVRVLGAASMGALRAAECCAFGMEGVGRIFAQYRSGERSADADVAVLHAPAALAYAPLTVALVDAEETLQRLLELSLLGAAEVASLIEAARRLHFKERVWQAVIHASSLAPHRKDAILAAIDCQFVSRKRLDAVELLMLLIEAGPPQERRPRLAPEDFNRTAYFAALERQVQTGRPKRHT